MSDREAIERAGDPCSGFANRSATMEDEVYAADRGCEAMTGSDGARIVFTADIVRDPRDECGGLAEVDARLSPGSALRPPRAHGLHGRRSAAVRRRSAVWLQRSTGPGGGLT